MRAYWWVGIGIIALLAILNLFGILRPLNEVIPQNPDFSCRSDADCVLRADDCVVDCRFIVTNKGWSPFCPFHDPRVFDVCGSPGVAPRCDAGVCVAVNGS